MSNSNAKDSSTLAAAAATANQATITAGLKLPEDKPKDTRSHAEIQADAVRNRAELAATLDAIEYRINVPKRLAHRIRVLRDENPAVLAAAGVAAAALVGAVVFVGARSLLNR